MRFLARSGALVLSGLVAASAGGCGILGGGGSYSPAAVPVITTVLPEPALPAGVLPVPTATTTPMRITGTDFPVAAVPGSITIRLTSATAIFAGGSTTSIDLAAVTSATNSIDFTAPAVSLGALASVPVAMLVVFPTGATAVLDPAFSYEGTPAAPPAPAPVVLAVAPNPALPVGITPVPSVQTTPMRATGSDFPIVGTPGEITLRLTSATPIFSGGTSTSIDLPATAATATTIDFTAPRTSLDAVGSATVGLVVVFPVGDPAAFPTAFTYQAPSINTVNTVVAGTAGASGILNPNLSTTGTEPIHLFARRGGDPFVIGPASGRTFAPLPVPAAGTVFGPCDVAFRTAGSRIWPGSRDSATVSAEIVSNGSFWEIRGSTPGDLTNETTGQSPTDVAVTVLFDDWTRQAVPGTGARFVRTTQRVFAVTSGSVVAFGQNPGAAAVTAAATGSAAGSGPMAGDPEGNRLYVASGANVAVFDTAACANISPAPTIGPRAFRAASPTGATIAFSGAAVRSMAIDPVTGELWVVNDLGVQIADPSFPAVGITTLPVPSGLGLTTHGDRVVYMEGADAMLVSLFDGAAGAGTEAFLLYDASTRILLGVYTVPAMTAVQATLGGSGISLGNPTRIIVSDGTPNGNTATSQASNLLTTNRPAATGAVWNREFAVKSTGSGIGRVFLLYDNTGPTTGTVVAVNAVNALINGVPDGFASGAEISLPMDWLHVLDLSTGGSTASQGINSGAHPLGVNALIGPNDGERGSIAFDSARNEVLVHAATTGGTTGFTFVNVKGSLAPVAPSGPPYTAGSFAVSSAALAALINNALTPSTIINTPSAFQAGVIPSQEHLRIFSAPGAGSTNSGQGTLSVVPAVILVNPTLGAARGSAQRTAEAILIDRVPGSANGNWFLFGGTATGDLTKLSFDGTTVTVNTAAGAAPLTPAAGATAPVFATSP